MTEKSSKLRRHPIKITRREEKAKISTIRNKERTWQQTQQRFTKSQEDIGNNAK